MRVVHLVRHPVPTCLSWLTHSAYEPPLLPHLDEKVLLSPSDAGVRFGDYQECWDTLSPFEKCLYFWCEVNALALELQKEYGKRWLTLRYEDLFEGDGLARLLTFLELPVRDNMMEARSDPSDSFRYVTTANHDWRTIHQHPRALKLADRLGYKVGDVDCDAIYRRYVLGQP